MHDAPEIRIYLSLELVGGHLFERTEETVSGVIHNNIDVAKGIQRGGNGSGHFGWRRDVQPNRPYLVPIAFAQVGEILRLARLGNDLVACDHNGLAQRTPKSARTPSVKPNSSLNI